MCSSDLTLDADGAPLLAPIWFVYEEGRIWFTPRQHSEWLANIRRDPRVALCIDERVFPYRKVIVRGGENMSPGEIEDVLLTHPAIADACACAIPSVEWGESVGVALVSRRGREPAAASP